MNEILLLQSCIFTNDLWLMRNRDGLYFSQYTFYILLFSYRYNCTKYAGTKKQSIIFNVNLKREMHTSYICIIFYLQNQICYVRIYMYKRFFLKWPVVWILEEITLYNFYQNKILSPSIHTLKDNKVHELKESQYV